MDQIRFLANAIDALLKIRRVGRNARVELSKIRKFVQHPRKQAGVVRHIDALLHQTQSGGAGSALLQCALGLRAMLTSSLRGDFGI